MRISTILFCAVALSACTGDDTDKPDDSIDDIYDDGPGGGDDDSGTTDSGIPDGVGLPDCSSSEGHATTIERVATTTTGTVDMVVSYGGGCETHAFQLCWPDGTLTEEVPVMARLELLHTGPPDPCEAWITEELSLDVTPMAEAYRTFYGSSTGEMMLDIHGHGVLYTF